MSVVNQCSFVQQLEVFGQTITGCVETLNDVCLNFFSFINGHVFRSEEDWSQALSTFKASVLEHAAGTRTERAALYQQIEQILLNPSKVVTGKCAKRMRVNKQAIKHGSIISGDGGHSDSLRGRVGWVV